MKSASKSVVALADSQLSFSKGELAIYTDIHGAEFPVVIEGAKGRWVAIRTTTKTAAWAVNTPINCARAALQALPVAVEVQVPDPAPSVFNRLGRAAMAVALKVKIVEAPAPKTPKTSRPVKIKIGSDDSETVITGMSILHQRLKSGKYIKAENGQPCCGDRLALAFGVLSPVDVCNACVIALALPGNPYLHLNLGQQSMNLRNRVRGALNRGDFGNGVVDEAIQVVQEAAIK